MKKITALFISFSICIFASFMLVCADDSAVRDISDEKSCALVLKDLGLFKGVSDTSFDLERAPTRVEALVMLIRVLGKEQDALNGTWRHPFTDVPAWADAYVAYAYVNGLTNGVSVTQFGSDNATSAMYLTFMLRALGYSDVNNTDFSWNNPYDLAKSAGILPDIVDTDVFLRADVACVSFAALSATLKNSEQTLADKLIEAGVLDANLFFERYDIYEFSYMPPDTYTPPTQVLNAVQISEKCSPAVFFIETYAFNGEPLATGSGFFISSDGFAVTNYHVAANAAFFVVTTTDGEKYDNVSLIDHYKNKDLALLKVNADCEFPYLEFGNSNSLKQGQTVYAIGSPLGLDNTMSQGIVSNPRRTLAYTRLVQISVPINHGSSGGALINEYGEVVGVTSGGFETTGDLNVAVPINYARLLDKSRTEELVAWQDNYYPGFSQIYDFGSFSGIDLISTELKPLGYALRYDIRDAYDVVSLDGNTIYRTATDCLNYCIYYYVDALQFAGMELISDTEPAFWLESLTEKIYIVINKDDLTIDIYAECIPDYYDEEGKIPDAGWCLGLPLVLSEKIDDSYCYYYKWYDYYNNAEDFMEYFEMYATLLEDEGFELVYEEEDEDGSYGYLFEGNGYSITIVITDTELYVDFMKKITRKSRK